MKKIIFILFLILLPISVKAGSLGQKLSGKILLNVEKNGEAWYIYPDDYKRYFLGRPDDAFNLMRELGLGVTEVDFQKIAASNMPVEGDLSLASKLAGKIVLQVEKNGEAWYINPEDLKKYFLGRPKDAFKVMRELSLGITSENLAKIHKPGLEESIDENSNYKHLILSANGVEYSAELITIKLDNPKLKIVTDVAYPYPTETNKSGIFGSKTLAEFVLENDGFAGINGTYFESYDSSNKNYYFFPVYDTNNEIMINEDQLKYWTTGPIMVWDNNNKFYYFKDSREFNGVAEFEKNYNTKIQAAIGNKPRLIENKMDQLIEWDIDEKQRSTKALRNAIGYKENILKPGYGILYLVVARDATIPDLAYIMKSLEVDYALNLDGGYSSALWYNDEYMIGPGRDVVNALIFSHK